MTAIDISDFAAVAFQADGISHQVFSKGAGPDILLMHELPGMTVECIRLARTLEGAGFRVHMPLLFGDPGDDHSILFTANICIGREINLFLNCGESPLLNWLRAYGRQVYAGNGGKGIGVIGMCLTGNFAISMLADEFVLAPVSSEPALPFGLSSASHADMAISDADLVRAKARNAAGVPLMCLRFSNDKLSPQPRYRAIQEAFPAGFRGTEIPSQPGNPDGISPKAHSVLTKDFCDKEGHPTRAALGGVIAFMRERLR
jgi:dienelactone hydrolase